MKYLNALNNIDGIGHKTFQKLFSHFESAEQVWNAHKNDLLACGISERLADSIIQQKAIINPEKLWEVIEREHIFLININSEQYPALLREISSPPYVLYAKGNIDLLNNHTCVSMVGSRTFTSYGKMAAEKLSFDLAQAGICIVSGLAFGIDAISHQGALAAQGKTIAVLGNSLDEKNISPRSNFRLAQEILQSEGLLISEFTPPTQASKYTFPMRNRIIAGLSRATVIIEANEKSGSLITANYALDFNRDIFAVPGPIFSPQSEGTNNLIKKGARLVASMKDILEEISAYNESHSNHETNEQEKIALQLSSEEHIIVNILSGDPLHIDHIIKHSKLDSAKVSSLITMLEIKGAIKNTGGQNYIRL